MRTKPWKWLAAGAAMACATAAGAQDVSGGISAWQQGDYARAVEIWRPLAQAGDADAAFNLGQAYRLGRGVPVDLATAQVWLEQAALGGHMDAQTTLGLLLFESGNRTGGLRWLRQAADQGEPRAMLVFGTALFNGDGVPQDPVRAYAYVSGAAAAGLAPAKSTLEQMDEILSVEQRREGLRQALEMAKSAAKPKAEPKVAATSPPPEPARKAEPSRGVASAPSATAPPKPSTAKAPSRAPASGNWRIQLGAFSNRASAEALFRKLSGSAPVAGRQLHLVPVGAITRLQVGPFESRAAATAACRTLSAKGQPCFVVAPK